MRVYVVQVGDSPADIAARDSMAGCPKCAIDLVRANLHKEVVIHKNGFTTFKELRVGEKLVLPEKWFDGTLDRMPPEYFASLPHPDGVTPGKIGVSGALGDYAALDTASAKVGALSALADQPFSLAVADTAAAIDISVREVGGTSAPALRAEPYVQAARASATQAIRRNVDLVAAIGANDQTTARQARLDILRDFSDALASARHALRAFYEVSPSTPAGGPSSTTSAAQAAAAAIAADPSYCTAVAHPGSLVNSAVHAFKTAWNASNPSNPVPIGTGNYEQATADAIKNTLGTAPAACAQRPPPFIPGGAGVTPPQEESGLSTSALVGLSLIGVGAVGGAIYLATREPAPRVRRVRPRPSRKRFEPEPIPAPARWRRDPIERTGWGRYS